MEELKLSMNISAWGRVKLMSLTLWALMAVADLGFHERGLIRLGALAKKGKKCKPRPLLAKNHALYVVEQYPRC